METTFAQENLVDQETLFTPGPGSRTIKSPFLAYDESSTRSPSPGDWEMEPFLFSIGNSFDTTDGDSYATTA